MEVEGTKARAFEVGAKNLVALTKKNMIELDATGKVGVCQKLVTVREPVITANGNKVSFRQQVQSLLGWAGGNRVGKLGNKVINGMDRLQVL